MAGIMFYPKSLGLQRFEKVPRQQSPSEYHRGSAQTDHSAALQVEMFDSLRADEAAAVGDKSCFLAH